MMINRLSHFTSALVPSNRHTRLVCVCLFFLTLLLVGLDIYRDYGISCDEPISRLNGMVTLNHLMVRFAPTAFANDMQLAQYNLPLDKHFDRDYGVAFETPVSFLERLLQKKDTRDIYMFRHLLTFLVCVGGIFAVFRLAERRFADWRLGLLVALCLVLSPRFFAESFYNDKDVVFMAFFAIAMNTMMEFLLKPGIRTALVHALATAVAIDVRIMAVILPMVTLFILLLRLARGELQWRTVLPAMVAYVGVATLLVVALWPWLWPAPWKNFLQAFANMAKFRWPGSVLYMGAKIPASQLPWHYIPVWIVISTPLVYSALFLLGTFCTVRQMLSRRFRLWKGDSELQDVIFLGLFASPLFAVIVLHSVLYDGWRQMYFLYPAFLLGALKGWITLWRALEHRFGVVSKCLLVVIMLLSLVHTATWMVKVHPFQNVYFNIAVGKDWKNHFEMDYWGLSNRQALEYILEQDNNPLIKIYPGSALFLDKSLPIIKPLGRSRIRVVDNEADADYILTNYRLNATDYASPAKRHVLFYQIRIGDEVIYSIFKRRPSQENVSAP